MINKEYPVIEVKLGNYTRKFQMRETYIGTFVVEGKLFTVVGSTHTLGNLSERNLNKYHILSTIVGLGEDLVNYNNNNKHIIVSSQEKECSMVFTIEDYTVVLITVLDKGQMHTSRKVTKETINLSVS